MMKQIIYFLATVGLLCCCSDNEEAPPSTPVIGTGTYQPVASRQFYPPYFAGFYPAGNKFEIYSGEKSFEYYYYHHPKAERIDPSAYSVILASARQTHSDWNIYGQGFYKTGRNRYILVAHLCPQYCENWSMSALVPALPSDAEIGLLEIMHEQKVSVTSTAGNYELFQVVPYPEPEECWSGLEIIRTQTEFDEYFLGRTDVPPIDFSKHSLLAGYWAGASPLRQTIQFAKITSGKYVLSVDRYYDLTSDERLGGYCVLVPAIPEDATVGILTTNYWNDGTPINLINDRVGNDDYELPASFAISEDIPDDLIVIRTQEDFDRYFSGYPDAAAVKFDWYTLLIARGRTSSTVEKVSRNYYGYVVNDEGGYYEYSLSVTLRDDTNPDTWYTALLVSKLDDDEIPKLKVEYK